MLIRDAELCDGRVVDLRVQAGRVAEIAARLAPESGEDVLDAQGGALRAGLHDHHIHLFAAAAAADSVRCGPPAVHDRAQLAAALASAPERDGWVRGVGYHEQVAGPLDRHRLDALEPRRALRIQHRSGALWMLNSAALARIDPAATELPEGFERDAGGAPTGRLFDLDGWLRGRLAHAPSSPTSLAELGARLARRGVTGVTDATPGNGAWELAAFAEAVGRGALRQRVLALGTESLAASDAGDPERVGIGALKLVLRESALPEFDAFCARIEDAHARGRCVAVHCVTRVELVFLLEALQRVGSLAGDRIEHASVAPPELLPTVDTLGLRVVTQPNFVRERGDAYLREVEERDRPWLYRCRGWLEAGVPLAGGTDAPFGDDDPWLAMQAAVDRRSVAGRVLGADERLSPEAAFALFSSPARAPGDAPREVTVGSPADLVVLDRPWIRARDCLGSEMVRATVLAGALTWRR